MKKRVLAILTAMIMAVTMLPIAAFAEGEDPATLKDIRTATFDNMDSYTYDGYDGWEEPMLSMPGVDGNLFADIDFTYAIVKASDGSPAPAKPVAGKYKVFVFGNEASGYTGTIYKDFEIYKAAQAVSAPTSYSTFYGDKAYKLPVRRTQGDGKLVFKSSNPSVVTVDQTGTIKVKKIKKVKTVKITVYAAATANYKQSPTRTITIKAYPKQKTTKAYKKYIGKWKGDDFRLKIKVMNKNYLHAIITAKNGDTITIKKIMNVKKKQTMTLKSKKGQEVDLVIKMKCKKWRKAPDGHRYKDGPDFWCEGTSNSWNKGADTYIKNGKEVKIFSTFYRRK